MELNVGPTGNLIQGSIFDVSKTKLESLLKRYDEQLYLKWNTKKAAGRGCWELRRRPLNKVVVDSYDMGDYTISRLEYKEIDVENHIWDLPALSYSLLDRLKACDIWDRVDYQGKSGRVEKFTRDMEQNYYDHKGRQAEKAHDDLMYGVLQDKKILKDFQERIVSGVDPRHLLRYWK